MGFGDDVEDEAGKRLLGAGETLDHGGNYALAVQHLGIERQAGMLGEERQEGELRAAVAFAEGVHGVDLGQQVRRMGREFGGSHADKVGCRRQLLEDAAKLVFDKLRIAEPVAPLPDPDGGNLTGPVIDVLEQVTMQGEVMSDVQSPSGQGSSARTTNMAVSNSSRSS